MSNTKKELDEYVHGMLKRYADGDREPKDWKWLEAGVSQVLGKDGWIMEHGDSHRPVISLLNRRYDIYKGTMYQAAFTYDEGLTRVATGTTDGNL